MMTAKEFEAISVLHDSAKTAMELAIGEGLKKTKLSYFQLDAFVQAIGSCLAEIDELRTIIVESSILPGSEEGEDNHLIIPGGNE